MLDLSFSTDDYEELEWEKSIQQAKVVSSIIFVVLSMTKCLILFGLSYSVLIYFNNSYIITVSSENLFCK